MKLCKIGKETRKKAKLHDIPQKELSSLLLCSVCRCPKMSKYSVHSVTLLGFIWSSGKPEEPESQAPREAAGSRGLCGCVSAVDPGFVIWNEQAGVVPAQEWDELLVLQVHSLLSHTTSCGCSPEPLGVSVFQTECQPGTRAVGVADSQEPLPNTCTDPIKGLGSLVFLWLFVFGFLFCFSWTAHLHCPF